MMKFLDRLFSWVPTPMASYMEMENKLLEHRLEMMRLIYNASLSNYEKAAGEQIAKQNRFTVINGGLE